MLQTIRKTIAIVTRAIMGHEFYTIHIDIYGNRKIFPCTNMQDALEWCACALNEDQVKIIDRNGYFVASRGALKA